MDEPILLSTPRLLLRRYRAAGEVRTVPADDARRGCGESQLAHRDG